jgi:ABC-2 type transport system permease protein
MKRFGVLVVLAAALGLVLSGCGSTGLSEGRLATSLSRTFSNLYVLQQSEQGNPKVSSSGLNASTSCVNGAMQGGGEVGGATQGSGVWLCSVTYYIAGPGYPVVAKYKVDVQTDGCYAADGDGPASVNGYPTISGTHSRQLINPLALIDACFDTT